MNYKIIFYTVGQVLLLEAALLLLPMSVSFIYSEWSVALDFGITACVAFLLGGTLFLLCKNRHRSIFAKEGLIIVSLAWVSVSAVGALPFVISNVSKPSFSMSLESRPASPYSLTM